MASLSENPEGLELEDFVAAHLASRGFLVEMGVTERDPVDILELDVVWTDYSQPEARRVPIEVKSGEWGLGDLFKFYGWSRYLELEPGWYFCRRIPRRSEPDTVRRLCSRLGISLCHVEHLADAPGQLAALGLPAVVAPDLPILWRFSYWIQRRLLRSLGAAIESGRCPESARAARNYHKLINDAIFFEPDVRARVSSLLDAHWRHPRLAQSAAAESAGLGVHLDEPPRSKHFQQALYNGKHFPVQACLYLAHRARLSLIKSAVDYLIARARGTVPARIVTVLGTEIDLGNAGLHRAFQDTTSELEDHEHFRRYPGFWQTFLWSWGGFVLLDRKELEYQALSEETGVPVASIDTAFGMWDRLFPVEGGWFSQPKGDTRRQLKLMPAALRGVGAFRRLKREGSKDYAGMKLSGETGWRLASDHNCIVRLLDGGEDELIQ